MLHSKTNDPSNKSARMEQRTTREAKDLIERAAAIVGLNASEFTVQAATEAARRTVQQYETTALKPEAHAAFQQALDAVEPTDGLVDLMRRHSAILNRK